MTRVLTGSQMQSVDLIAQEKYGIHGLVLMERAAMCCVDVLLESFDLNKVLIVCGSGNNGGDGICVSRLLIERGIIADVWLVGDINRVTDSTRCQLDSAKALGINIYEECPTGDYTTIVDAIFGVSLNRAIEGRYVDAVEYINASKAKVLSVDMPSGVNCDDGRIMGCAVKADVTVTFQFPKVGQLLYPGYEFCGITKVVPIGIPKASLQEIPDNMNSPHVTVLEKDEIKLPDRSRHSNKGTYGKVLLIAGSKDVYGAAILSALASMRSGCGMIKVVTAFENKESFANIIPEAMLLTYTGSLLPEAAIYDAIDWCDCIAIGPGIGQDFIAERLTEIALEQDKVPVVVDADALNILSRKLELLNAHLQDIIITPHVGEMSRLTGLDKNDISTHLIEIASDFANNYGVICVLKDDKSIISGFKGDIVINDYGCSGMATAGSGDVLTGIIAALIAGGMKSFDAAALGCAIHGVAGEKGSLALSEHELLARDIIKYIE